MAMIRVSSFGELREIASNGCERVDIEGGKTLVEGEPKDMLSYGVKAHNLYTFSEIWAPAQTRNYQVKKYELLACKMIVLARNSETLFSDLGFYKTDGPLMFNFPSSSKPLNLHDRRMIKHTQDEIKEYFTQEKAEYIIDRMLKSQSTTDRAIKRAKKIWAYYYKTGKITPEVEAFFALGKKEEKPELLQLSYDPSASYPEQEYLPPRVHHLFGKNKKDAIEKGFVRTPLDLIVAKNAPGSHEIIKSF